MTDPTAALAVAATTAVLAVLAALVVRLLRSESTGTHELTGTDDAYLPRPYNQVILGEAYISIPLPDAGDLPPDFPQPKPDPVPQPTVEEDPIDELDPRWDWRAYAAEHELAAA